MTRPFPMCRLLLMFPKCLPFLKNPKYHLNRLYRYFRPNPKYHLYLKSRLYRYSHPYPMTRPSLMYHLTHLFR
jgi:hypothetical protein